jgi:lysophospholipase L1-like esterase
MRGLTVKRSWMTGLVLALLVLSGSSAVAGPPPGGPHRGHPVHVVIGDSLPAGQQSVPPAVDFPTTAALWKANGFVAQFHRVLRDELTCSPGRPHHRPGKGCHALELVNLSRTGIPGVAAGVTTATVLQPGDQLDQAVALIEKRNGNRTPRDDVRVVTVSVGGNDVYGPAIQACVPPTGSCLPTLEATFTGFETRYGEILATLRESAGPRAAILAMTYYNPLPFCALGAADPATARALGDFILEGGDIGLGPMPLGFNDRLRLVAVRYGAVVVDTFGALGAGDFVGGADCVHPDGDGHRVLAGVFARTFPG